MKEIKRALISVYNKDGILEIAKILADNGVEILSTGGTYNFLQENSIPVTSVESITGYPSILGGRVKTLHPKIFGGILNRRDNNTDILEISEYNIPAIDLVIVDLYPFEEYVAANATHNEIIEKIDIGGISLIRGAAKNYNDVVIIPSKDSYKPLLNILKEKGCNTTIEEREYFAAQAFLVSSHYDTAIFNFFNTKFEIQAFKKSILNAKTLRYGENPHQKGIYYGCSDSLPKQLHGKEISHNNLLDVEAAIELISDFTEITVGIIKHNNACGCASAPTVKEAWEKALAADPVSAFGGIIVTNKEISKETAELMNKIFFEVIIAPAYTEEALEILKSKKNRIILESINIKLTDKKFRSLLGGVLVQDRDSYVETPADLKPVTQKQPRPNEIDDLLFANKLVKHSKSNAIVLVKGKQLLASGIGQTSRVDSLKQAIQKAKSFNFSLNGAVMSSDAFFPFADCVEIAAAEGIKTVIQPGGSIRDNDSVEYCNKNDIAMVMTGIRHFKH
ncbi:MAG: bifunctional phosphoribosylaminoimidazolecarboxamide formyltransferase/IMP cyclohydrolase [Bacteroidales bacterium]